MLYTVIFEMKTLGQASRWPEYRWWNEFVERFFIVGQDFEIRCWKEDFEGIESAKRFGVEVPNRRTEEVVFQGMISEHMLDEIHMNYLSNKGTLKWFSMFIHCPSGERFQCEHYGNELYLVDCKKDIAEDTKLWSKKFECFNRSIILKQE